MRGGYNSYRPGFRSVFPPDRSFRCQQEPRYNYRRDPPGPPRQKPPIFAVVLECGVRGGRRDLPMKDVDELIAGCPAAPDKHIVFPSGEVAAKLFFRQWPDALEAAVYLWGRRLDGAHLMVPRVLSNTVLPSHRAEEKDRLRDLFAVYGRGLLSCEAVRRHERRIEELTARIQRLLELMRVKSRLELFQERQERRRSLEKERDLARAKLEEFLAGIRCLLARLGEPLEEEEVVGFVKEEGEVEVFVPEGNLDLGRIHLLMVRECRRLDEGLPIYASRRKILRAINSNQVIVLIGETGSGKSTQLVQFLADSGLAVHGSVVCTQPRKIAAISLAQRINEESFGCYKDNFVTSYLTYSSAQRLNSEVVFTTDHCFLQHCMNNMSLPGVSYIIVDEAHERSLNTDLILALVKKQLLHRFDLRLIIMSATADARKLADFFCGCCTFNVMGRNFPVEIKYVPDVSTEASWTAISKNISGNCASYVSDVVKMVSMIHKTEDDGAILAFLTSQMEVEWACENFQSPSAVVLPLHGKLPCEEQCCVFKNYPGKRKVIFSTNLAETSLTIPGVKYVVDSGMVKESRFEPSSGMNILKVCRISQSSAEQRAGRAGRTESGKCYRLYSESDFHLMPLHQEPEICKVHLGIASLRILALGVKNVQEFEFIDAPSPNAIETAIQNLIQVGAIVCKNEVFEITDTGRQLVKLGIEPRLGKIILDCHDCGLSKEGVVLAALMANASSIFCRVGSDADKLKADSLRVPFCHRDGDLFTLLSVYKEWEHEQDSRNKWCWQNSINAKSMRRCEETVTELDSCLRHELNVIIPTYWKWDLRGSVELHKLLKKVILSSLAASVAMYSGYDRLGYEVASTGQHLQLHPSCSLLIYGHKPSWVVFGEILSITKQYLVCVTAIDPESLYTIQPPPPFDVSVLESRKMQMNVIVGVGQTLLRRLCGKASYNMQCLVSRIQKACTEDRISVEVDFDKRLIQLYALSRDMEKVSCLVNDALDFETKCLRDECTEKCLFRGGPGFSPSKALFGSGAEIKHLELDKRYLTVEVCHPNAHALDDKGLLMIIGQYVSGIANFYRHAGTVPDASNSDKWGKITFLSPEDAEKAVDKLNELELHGSKLTVYPIRTVDDRAFPFPAVKAKVCLPRRHSKGFAIIRCAWQDADCIVQDCANLVVGGKYVRCEVSKKSLDNVVVGGLDRNTSEEELHDAMSSLTDREIHDVYLVRGDTVNHPSTAACEEALLREIAPFMSSKLHPSNTCRVEVFNPGPMDCWMKAIITFDGRLHLEAAKALDHLHGRVLSGCHAWQKIKCQQMFHSSVSCPAHVFHVIKKHLDILLENFRRQKGVSHKLEKNDNGSYRVKIFANGTKTIADLRKPLERLMKGNTVSHPSLTPTVMQLLFSRDGVSLMKSLERESGTCILYDKQNLNIKVFGAPKEVDAVEKKLVESLVSLHESKQLEICLRGGDLPLGLMKEVVQRFGPDLHALKEKVPGADFLLNTCRHILFVRGSKELKQKVEEIILDVARSLDTDRPAEQASEAICPICLCELEEPHQLEACGHEFCRACLVDQCESTIRSRDGFPLCCIQEGCTSPFLLVDLRSLLSAEKLEELFRASLGAFVASSGGAYRVCPSPDCPAVYRVADPDAAVGFFACGACSAETCTKCHLEYHPFVSCERYKEFKDDPDTSLEEWRKGKENVKNCPVCSHTIEKTDGCNHMECRCGRHICWVCLESFQSSEECYAHLGSVHHALS